MRQPDFLSPEELRTCGFASFGRHVLIDRSVRLHGAERISVGSHVRIDAFGVISAGAGGIAIGDYVHIGAHTFIAGAGRIELRDFSGLSGRVSIYSSNDDYHGNALTNPTVPDAYRNVSSAPVTLEPHVIVGAGSVILPGVTLRRGAAVGALTLVRKDVAEFTIVSGQNAAVIGTRQRDLLESERKLRAATGD